MSSRGCTFTVFEIKLWACSDIYIYFITFHHSVVRERRLLARVKSWNEKTRTREQPVFFCFFFFLIVWNLNERGLAHERADRRGWHLSWLSAIKSHKLILLSTGIAYDERVADNRKALNFQEYCSQINIHNFQQIISEGGLRELHN